MIQNREYQKYVNTSDKMLKEIDEIRLKLSQKLSKMNSQKQLAYFNNASNSKGMIIQDSNKAKYKA
ncbi:MAG: hypothetical protein ABH896_03400 [Candidatus Jacksonbacteria bacterium]